MGGGSLSTDLTIRPAHEADESAVLDLLHTTMGWSPADPNRDLFRWKHRENPAGPSLSWVAEDGGRIVGFRTFLRWRFRQAGAPIEVVRAVDTATHPDHQGRGIFSRLTLHALDALTTDGYAFVFNTPNDNSRPGYLKMGWRPVGRLPIAFLPHGPVAAGRTVRARVPAERWSLPSTAGEPALDVLTEEVVARAMGDAEITTDRSLEHLRWRYGFAPLHYRALTDRSGATAVFRLRRRGDAQEAAICELFAPSHRTRARLVRAVVQASGADYAVSLGPSRSGLPLPAQGPLLVQRSLNASGPNAVRDWRLTLGDIELF